MFKLFDVVKIKPDVSLKNVPIGASGTIIMVYDTPNLAYEVEFVDTQGRTIDTIAVTPENLEKYTG